MFMWKPKPWLYVESRRYIWVSAMLSYLSVCFGAGEAEQGGVSVLTRAQGEMLS